MSTSKKYDSAQISIFDGINLCELKKNLSRRMTKKQYSSCVFDLVTLHNKGLISFSDMLFSLHLILENYRKDYPNVK